MITYIDSENRQNYTVLFDKASTKLGLKPIIEEVRDPETHEITKHYFKRKYDQTTQAWITVPCEPDEIDTTTDSILVDDENGNKVPVQQITSLNEYFQHIRDLAGMAIGTGRTGTDPYFLRLPLDEPFFEINANTRGITVPGELSQIAVKGDKLAEVVFFRIDRYYDAVDLNTRHIYIEWELPDGTKGISRDFLRDTQSEKDKIIFGWAIGEELTKQVGTIRFAVRFVEWFDNTVLDQDDRRINLDTATEDTQMLYSFSSLPATVSVVDSLNYSLFEDDEDLKNFNSLITEDNIGTMVLYLEDSDPDSVNETAPELAAMPKYVRDLSPEFYVEAKPITGKENEYKINLIGEYGAATLELRVEANAEDGGQISYVFGYIAHTKDEGTGVAATGASGMVAKYKFIEATDVFTDEDEKTAENFNTKKTFFIKDSTGVLAVVNANDAALAVAENPDVKFFEKVAYVEVNAPGHYYAIADNRAGGKKANSAYSSTFYIPWPSKPEVETKMASRFVGNELEYTLAADESFNEASIDNRGKTNLRTSTTVVADTNLVELKPTVTAEETAGLTYTWYKNANNHLMDSGEVANAANYTRPEGLKDEVWAAQEATLLTDAGWEVIEGATAPTYVASEPGCYAVKVTNKFNNKETQSDLLDAGACRVTGMPKIPSIDWTSFKASASAGAIPNAIDIELKDINGDAVDYDKIEYQWHKVTIPDAEHPGLATDLELATEDDMTSPASPVEGMTFDAEGKAKIPFQPKVAGAFFLEVRNTLNGATVIYNGGEDELIGTIQISA